MRTKRSYIHKIIIPEQFFENPNFKMILVVKEWPTLCGIYAAPNIFACSLKLWNNIYFQQTMSAWFLIFLELTNYMLFYWEF